MATGVSVCVVDWLSVLALWWTGDLDPAFTQSVRYGLQPTAVGVQNERRFSPLNWSRFIGSSQYYQNKYWLHVFKWGTLDPPLQSTQLISSAFQSDVTWLRFSFTTTFAAQRTGSRSLSSKCNLHVCRWVRFSSVPRVDDDSPSVFLISSVNHTEGTVRIKAWLWVWDTVSSVRCLLTSETEEKQTSMTSAAYLSNQQAPQISCLLFHNKTSATHNALLCIEQFRHRSR